MSTSSDNGSKKGKKPVPVSLQVEPYLRDFLKYKQAIDLAASGKRQTINDIVKHAITKVYSKDIKSFNAIANEK